MEGILFFELYFVLIMILSIVMFFVNKKDIWFQFLWIGTFVIHLVFLMFAMHDFNNYQMGYATSLERVYIDGANKDSTNLSQDILNSSNRNHVSNFDYDDVEESYFRDVNFCFMYNNSDAINTVEVVNEREVISEQIYLKNNTFGTYCLHINSTHAKEGHYLGINCLDCTAPNSLGLVLDNNGVPGTSWNIDSTNHLSYSLETHRPYLFWLEIRTVPYKGINDWYFTYLWVLGSLVLIFASYTVIKIMKGETEKALK